MCWQSWWIVKAFQGCCSDRGSMDLLMDPLTHRAPPPNSSITQTGGAAARPFTMRLLEVHHEICPNGFGPLLMLYTLQKLRESHWSSHTCRSVRVLHCMSLLWLWLEWVQLLLSMIQIKGGWVKGQHRIWRSCLRSLILSLLVILIKQINNQVLRGISG